MTYSLLFYEVESEFARREGPDAPAYWGAWSSYIDLLAEEKALVPGNGAGLQPPSLATTVRVRSDQQQIQDGPFADTKEQLAGFVLLDVENLDIALRLAALAPCATTGAVEVRPIMPNP